MESIGSTMLTLIWLEAISDNIRSNYVTGGNDIDQLEPTKCSTVNRRSPALFYPGTRSARNWSLDVVVTE
eukprot:12400908-Ditylum_brightwellii.AAC.1